MSGFVSLLLACGGGPPGEAAPTPTSVAARFPDATIDKTCEVSFSAPDQLAVALGKGGAVVYMVVGASSAVRLGEGTPSEGDLSCFTAPEARDFGGRIHPVADGDVVCIFVSEVQAECYQDDGSGTVVRVGGWIN
jgi:hypothetical protein